MSAVLSAERLCVRHLRAERDAVRDASLQIGSGEVIALVGPNGSGKSTLLAALAGAIEPRAGVVRLHGRDLRDYGARERARRLARLPQEPRCPDGLTVLELVATGRYAHRSRWARAGEPDRRAIEDALEALRLHDHRNREVQRLSGGERRRAWIAMILAQEAPIVLLDEPTAALDLRFQLETLDHLVRLNRERGVTLVVVVHDVEHAARLADRVVVMRSGRVYEIGTPAQCIREETLQDVFGVRATVRDEDGVRVRVEGAADPIRHM